MLDKSGHRYICPTVAITFERWIALHAGAPGPRSHYSEGGIGCFVIDADDNNVEVAFQT